MNKVITIPEISDEEIELKAKLWKGKEITKSKYSFIEGAKWYKRKLKNLNK